MARPTGVLPSTKTTARQADGRFTLYEDDGKTFNYEKGQYRTRQLTVRKDLAGQFGLTEEITKETGPALFGPIEKLNVMTR